LGEEKKKPVAEDADSAKIRGISVIGDSMLLACQTSPCRRKMVAGADLMIETADTSGALAILAHLKEYYD
jgi:hypothetical protein